MLAFSGGESLAWDYDNVWFYGFSFTLASAKQIKAVGFYDAGGNGLGYDYEIQLISGWSGSAYGTGRKLTTGNDYSIYVMGGTQSALDGVWRKSTISNGATLAAGTYAVIATREFGIGDTDPMIKNASSVTPLSGVTINGAFALDYDGNVINTSGDSNGYFGPMLFF
jgi:hypothetical protein